ncbi:hypothetical protein [Streptomyces niveiscabiei]|uniref:hypothetical protein n=1 Tax=Streptomyces niveiscabiei TaxID=164115 RepID=UPI001F0AD855|nr:hypothetical protein [Streptomyces niveiscabiei]
MFDLSEGERQFLLTADRGQGLLAVGTHRVAFEAVVSPTEHHLITTDPAELAAHAEQTGGEQDVFFAPAHEDAPPGPGDEIDLGIE